MIFVTDKGRMANNMFQYGQVYAWGREQGRVTMSMRFAHKYPDFKIAHTPYHNTFFYLLGKVAAKLRLIPTVDFSDGHTDEKIATMQRHRHVLVTGWGVRFHHLFHQYKADIIDLFDFLPAVRHQVALVMQASTPDRLKLGVHIRRGDYKTWMGGRLYYDDAQYVSVIRQFAAMHPDRQIDVYVCTNDRQLDRSYFQQQLPAMRVFFPSGTAAEDLCLLSECDYLIGALSSFTLMASMYHNIPVYWLTGDISHVQPTDFHDFDYQSVHFDEYFVALSQS
jgi:hypothetical protein